MATASEHTVRVYAPLSEQQRIFYTMLLYARAGCRDQCNVGVISVGDDEDGPYLMIVQHGQEDDAHWFKIEGLHPHTGIDTDAVKSLEQLAPRVHALHGADSLVGSLE